MHANSSGASGFVFGVQCGVRPLRTLCGEGFNTTQLQPKTNRKCLGWSARVRVNRMLRPRCANNSSKLKGSQRCRDFQSETSIIIWALCFAL
eukprot:2986432-Alexandrium_andersonii.AAC.1